MINKARMIGPAQQADSTKGMRAPGNIDVHHRPHVKNADGTWSTLRSISIGTDKGEVLIPTVSPDARIMSNKRAALEYKRTGKNLGTFDSPANADLEAKRLHEEGAVELKDWLKKRTNLTQSQSMGVPVRDNSRKRGSK